MASADLNSSVAYEDDTPAPPGWKRKLVPRVGRGLTPTKTDVVYISPGGEEMKSKTQLQRYLKTHKGGPAVSEFNWSSGETPRRSGRITSKPHSDAMEVDDTPKNVKRKSSEIPQEESKAEKISSPRPKHTRKGAENAAVEIEDTGALSSDAAKEVAVTDSRKEEEDLSKGEMAKKLVTANGVAQGSKKDENLEAQEENVGDRKIVNIEEMELSSDAKDLEPSDFKLASSEKIDDLSEPLSNKVMIEIEKTAAIDLNNGESLEPLHMCLTAEGNDPESQEILLESSIRKDKEESLLSEASHHEERADVEGTVEDDEKGMQDGNAFTEEPEVVN